MTTKQNLREIQILLQRDLGSNSKEVQKIFNNFLSNPEAKNINETFISLFKINKTNNRDLAHYLDVLMKYIKMGAEDLNEIVEAVVTVRFIGSERDTDLVIVKYFEVINSFPDISSDLEGEILSRYIFMLSNNVLGNGISWEVYKCFRKYIKKREDMLRSFIRRLMYLSIDYSKEFITDFCDYFTKEELIECSLKCKAMRFFILGRTNSKYLFQLLYKDLPSWYLRKSLLFPHLYYNFDESGIYEKVSEYYYRRMKADDLIEILEKKEDYSKSCNFCKKYTDILQSEVEDFNKTGSITHLFDKYGPELSLKLLRYYKSTNLKKLGEFLCKLKNLDYLKMFANTFDFCNLEILDSLRSFLKSFHLASEGQVIHRVIETFSDKYFSDNANKCVFMTINDDNKTRLFLMNLSFSFLVLNTKFYNSNIKVKPTFQDYINDFTEEEIPNTFTYEYLESMYDSIKANQFEFPTVNKPGMEHFIVYKKILEDLKEKEMIRSKDDLIHDSFNICKECDIFAHRKLFEANYPSFILMEPENFYRICEKLNTAEPFEEYLNYRKNNTYAYLKSFSFYMQMDGSVKTYIQLFDVLKRIEKQKKHGNVFTEFKNSILNQSTRKDRISSQYKTIYTDLINSDLKSTEALCEALKIYKDDILKMQTEDIKSTECNDEDFSFITSVVIDILKRHLHKLGNLESLSSEGLQILLNMSAEKRDTKAFNHILNFMTPDILLNAFRGIFATEKGFINDEIVETFKKIELYNETGFHCAMHLQSVGYDMFDFIVTIKYENISVRAIKEDLKDLTLSESHKALETVKKDILTCYSIEERYKDVLSNSTNLFYFYSSSDSVINQAKAKNIHKKECPLKEKIFSQEEMDKRLIYLIRKADLMDNKDITSYTLWIVNLISSSLPLLSQFFTRNFGLLLTLENQTILNSIIKICFSRISKIISGSPLCCNCEYSSLADVEVLISMLLKYDLVMEKDFDFYYDGRNKMLNDGTIKKIDGVYHIVEKRSDEKSIPIKKQVDDNSERSADLQL